MIELYSLPPGYRYEVLSDEGMWMFAILNRADDVVMSVPIDFSTSGFFAHMETLWQMLEISPELAGVHTAAFLVWRLGSSPLDRLH